MDLNMQEGAFVRQRWCVLVCSQQTHSDVQEQYKLILVLFLRYLKYFVNYSSIQLFTDAKRPTFKYLACIWFVILLYLQRNSCRFTVVQKKLFFFCRRQRHGRAGWKRGSLSAWCWAQGLPGFPGWKRCSSRRGPQSSTGNGRASLQKQVSSHAENITITGHTMWVPFAV